jgi:riboflavin kinase/FMN adenylyltransferase
VHLSVGTFDGVHLGHQALLSRLSKGAHAEGALGAVFTFQNHPRHILTPDGAPGILTPWERKAELLAETGCDIIIGLPFTAEFSQIEAREFIRNVLVARCGARRIFSGSNFRFGHGGEGSPTLLRQQAPVLGYTFEIQEPSLDSGELISSTRIRAELAEGNIREAAKLLGRPPRLTSVVVSGDAQGRKIGFPTANMAPDPMLASPAGGVYAVRAFLADGSRWPAMMNIGVRPTFNGRELRWEVHLIGYSGILNDQQLAVDFIERLRPEQRFAKVAELSAQLARDRDAALAVLESHV